MYSCTPNSNHTDLEPHIAASVQQAYQTQRPHPFQAPRCSQGINNCINGMRDCDDCPITEAALMECLLEVCNCFHIHGRLQLSGLPSRVY
jgi:hypothetical protein